MTGGDPADDVAPSAAARRGALGRDGEDTAAAWYEEHGYEVLERNWRRREGEVDLIARQGRTVVFCEVKFRRSSAYGHPAEAVTRDKQQRLRRLAALWMFQSARRWREVRFDVVAITGDRMEVLTSAW